MILKSYLSGLMMSNFSQFEGIVEILIPNLEVFPTDCLKEQVFNQVNDNEMIGKTYSFCALVLVPLNDAWAEYTGEEFGGETNNTSDNTFRYPGLKPCRIDYIVRN